MFAVTYWPLDRTETRMQQFADDELQEDAAGPDPDEVLERVHARVDSIAQTELDRALARLDDQGGLTPAQRATVKSMTDAIADALVTPPAQTLREAQESNDSTAVRTVVELFDPEPERE